ncbi:hypothetical protein LJC01_01335 [Clostridiaceae bacterium OttesenSCG-928-D20]|nr:hypothetical protein [Clostridiaceae bacterium OttesenSCG-928-D20]
MKQTSKINWFEPIVFLFFGLFHIHRIWGLIDRDSYSSYWLSLLNNQGFIYYILMGIMSVLCIAGILVFIRNTGKNHWWRWFYIFGGGYVLFDLCCILVGWSFWNRLLNWMFEVTNPYWNIIWGFFILLGFVSLFIGTFLVKSRNSYSTPKEKACLRNIG